MRAIRDEGWRAWKLAELAHLTPPEHDQALRQALERRGRPGTRGTGPGAGGARTHLTPTLLGPALEAARAIGDEWYRVGARRRWRPT